MVKLPRAEQRSIYTPADMPHLAGDGWTAPGRALQGLGKAISGLGSALGEAEDHVDPRQLQEAKLAQLQFINDWNKDELDYRANYAGDGKDYGASRTGLFEQRSQEFMSRWPEPVRRRLEIPQERFRGSVQQDTYGFGYSRYNDTLYSNTDRAITGEMGRFATWVEDEERLNLYRENPEQFSSDLESHIQSVDAIIDGLPLAETKKDQLRTQAAGQLEDLLTKMPAGVTLGTVRQQIERFSAPRADDQEGQAASPTAGEPVTADPGEVSSGLFRAPGVEIEPRVKADAPYMKRARNVSGIRRIIMHGDLSQNVDNLVSYGQRVDKVRGFDPNYHFYIGRDGKIIQGVPLDRRANHTKGHNGDTIGIVVAGADNGKMPTPAQEAAAKRLIASLGKTFGIDPQNVVGHGELQPNRRHKLEGGNIAADIRANGYDGQVVTGSTTPAETQDAPPSLENRSLVRVAGLKPPANDAAPPEAGRLTGSGTVKTSSGEVRVAAGGQQPGGAQAFRGSVSNHLAERLIKKLPALEQKHRAEVAAQVKSVADRAARGEIIPPDEEAGIRAELGRLNDDEISTAFEMALAAARTTAQFKQLPPAALETLTLQMRARATAEGTSAAMSAQLAAMQKLHETMVKELKDNPLAWSVEAGVLPGLSPLEPTPEALAERAMAANIVAQHYGPQFFQAFTKDEQAILSETLNQGGPQTIAILSGIHQAFGADTPRVMKEFTKDAPEAATIGWMISANASPQAVKDAADALALRQTDGFKSIAPPAHEARSQALTVFSSAFRFLPQAEQKAIDMANLLYEVRARRAGVDPKVTDTELWKQGLKEALGENADPRTGDVYGGIVEQGGIWSSKYRQPITIPPNIKQDAFDDVIGALRVSDLVQGGMPLPEGEAAASLGAIETGAEGTAGSEATGGETAAALGVQRFANVPALNAMALQGAPLDDKDRPLKITTLQTRGTLVSIGDGRYWVALGDPASDDPQWVRTYGTRDGRFVLDLQALEPVLRERVPDAYRVD